MARLPVKPYQHRNEKTASAIAHWTKVCQSRVRDNLVKLAARGGDTTPFESAMSNLAHSYLQDRAPQLMDYLLGFQLIEKNEDNNRAVGVLGFQAGKQMMLAPVFFISGQLKGYELLYLKDTDTFVPLKDNWVNYLLSRKPKEIGKPIPKNTRPLGVEYPVLSAFSEIPGKYASDSWLEEGLPGLAYASRHYTSPPLLVPELVKMSSVCAHRLLSLIDAYPQVARPIRECYGDQLLKDALFSVKTANSILRMPDPVKSTKGSIYGQVWSEKKASISDKVRIYNYSGSPVNTLTVKQAEDLKRTGYLIDDKRDEHSQVYQVKQPIKLHSPTETGVYDVLTRPDKFEKCVIFFNTVRSKGHQPNCIVMRTDSTKSKRHWMQVSPGSIYVSNRSEADALKSYLAKLPEAKSLELGETYMLVAENGQATGVFEVESTEPSDKGEKAYRVRWENDYHNDTRPRAFPPMATRDDTDYEYRKDPMVVIGRPQSSSISLLGGTVYVPEGAKAIKIKPKSEYFRQCDPGDDDKEDPIRPGNLVDLHLNIQKEAHEMKVFSDGREAVVDGRRYPVKGALFHLVTEHGMKEKTANDILSESKKSGGARFYVKYAGPYHELQNSAPSAPAIPDTQYGTDDFFQSGVQANYPASYDMPVTGLQTMRPGQQNMAAPPDPQVMREVMQAAQSGQKEVLDTSLMKSLLKGTQDETVIDRYLSPLVKALDALGRIYFNFLWHHDMFDKRYGSDKMPELEDALRNNFDGLGDLVLELKQTAIDAYAGEGMGTDIEESSEI